VRALTLTGSGLCAAAGQTHVSLVLGACLVLGAWCLVLGALIARPDLVWSCLRAMLRAPAPSLTQLAL